MTSFALEIQSPARGTTRFENVVSFSGRDSSGSFGVLVNAERRMTVLAYGIARFQRVDGSQVYLALPGGLLYFRNNELVIVTQNYGRSSDFDEITRSLQNEIRTSEAELHETRQSLRRLDEEILKRLTRLKGKPTS